MEYGGPRVPRHLQKLHGTNKNCHGTNKNFTAQTKTVTAQTKTPRHKQKLHGTNKNLTAQTRRLTAEIMLLGRVAGSGSFSDEGLPSQWQYGGNSI